MATLLVIEDEPTLAKNIARYFRQHHHTVEIAGDGPSGIEVAKRLMPDVAIVDYQLPGLNGLDVIRELRRIDDQVNMVMVSGHASVAVAVDAMKAGTFDLLTKPVPLKTLKDVVDRALASANDRRTLDYYRRRDAEQGGIDAILGESRPVQALRELIMVLVKNEPTDDSPVQPILICGETGSGKELVARACHFSGPRAGGAFVELSCASLPTHLMEGELFGYEKGGEYTDRRIGLFEAADGGTLFLDEIGELDMGTQAKLLRVLENLRVRRIGALHDRQINVRVVAATNRDLDVLVRAGKFRADLLYRLRVFSVHVPSLRARGDDLWLLAQHFAAVFSQRYNKPPAHLDSSAEAALMQHTWPGNVRELRNVIERAVLLSNGGHITSSDLQFAPAAAPGAFRDSLSDMPEIVHNDELERSHLVRALEETRWDLPAAAALLSLDMGTLQSRMDRHALYAPGH